MLIQSFPAPVKGDIIFWQNARTCIGNSPFRMVSFGFGTSSVFFCFAAIIFRRQKNKGPVRVLLFCRDEFQKHMLLKKINESDFDLLVCSQKKDHFEEKIVPVEEGSKENPQLKKQF